MSWEVGDDEWLSDGTAGPAAGGPLDPLDDRVVQALSPAAFRASPASPDADEGLPPPPPSAAFDADSDALSYESGSFVADPHGDEPELDFHIPALALGVVVEPPPASTDAAQVDEPAPSGDAGFVIPTLSVSLEPVGQPREAVEEVEAEELEEVHEVPVRTGDTVIVRAPIFDVEPPVDVAEPVVNAWVEDEDDSGAMVIPELVERIDTAELMLEVDPAADAIPSEEPPAAESVGFVIPTLARAEPELSEVAEPEPEPEEDELDDDVPVLGISPSELVLPLLAAGAMEEPVVAATPARQTINDEEVHEEEVDAESIESLDAADLEELEQPVAVASAVEPAELRPPAPPETKAQGKRRKAWYDDVFAEHFLFLYPLTWEETCQRDAQFIHAQLGGREGLSVLDVGCGDGSHAVELAKLGARVTGLDNSLALLLAAAQTKEAAVLEEGRVEFIHGDMRRLPRDREFDAVICVGTTLGYFEEDQNWLCLQEMHDRLVPGGRLLIHVFNRDFVAPHLPSRSWWQGKRCMVIDEAEMNFFANRLRVHRTIIFDDGRQYEHYMFMRAYTVQDLGKAISQLGMRVLEVSGSRDTPGRFYGSASPDVWIVAEKK